jgi:Na+/melibiose symporter-like transporter
MLYGSFRPWLFWLEFAIGVPTLVIMYITTLNANATKTYIGISGIMVIMGNSVKRTTGGS